MTFTYIEPVEAFSCLQLLLRGEYVAEFACPKAPPFTRLYAALTAKSERQKRSSKDIAVLLRHALMFENARRGEPLSSATFEICRILFPWVLTNGILLASLSNA